MQVDKTTKDIVEGIQANEDLKRIFYLMRANLANNKGVKGINNSELPMISARECNIIGIERGSYLSHILAMYKELTKDK